MPLANIKPFLEDAKVKKYALGCFNVFNIETLEGVIEAAVKKRSPIVIAVYEEHFKYSDLATFSNLVKDISDKVDIPVILHLDHAEEISSIINAIKCNFTSFMFDGPPGISFKEKIKNTKKVAEIVHSLGFTIESELGYISRVGEKNRIESITDPNLVEEFVKSTGIDILTPSIGSVSGMNEQTAILNFDLLKEIKSKTNCYLSLHGTSGLNKKIIREAINIGVNKIVLYTRISNFAVNRIKTLVNKDGSLDLPILMNEARESFREMVEDRLEVYGCKNICEPQTNICNLCSSSSSKYCSITEKTKQNNFTDKQLNYSVSEEFIENLANQVIKEIRCRDI